MVFAASLLLIAVATLMFFGWGSAFRRLFRLEPVNPPLTVVLGMAAVVFIGGILNLARFAYPPALVVLAVIGVVLAIRPALSLVRPPVLISVLILMVLIFTTTTQLPPSIYNFHDDYQKYFAYPIRMVETGTVFGSTLSAMGLQTLGAQAFLDGFVVGFFPIRYINGVDAVFGLFLCLMLATQFSKSRATTLVCVLSVILINPQYVNVSTLFCGSALIMAMIAVEDPPSLGLLCAALIAMKPIYAVFIAIYLLASAFIAAGGIRWAIRAGLAAALFLSPWALVHAPNYAAAFRTHHPALTPVPGEIDTQRLNLFSFEPLAYGSTAANYTLLVIAIAACGMICRRSSRKTLACAITGVATFLVFVYVLGPLQYGYEHGLRYFTPVAIALAPAIFAWTASVQSRAWLPMLIAAVPLAAFGPSLRARFAMALETHSAVSYAWLAKDPVYVAYNRRVLSPSERDDVQVLQDRVPAGETILAWMNTPFYLDYKRNRIIDIDTAGIAVPWASVPRARYLIWDYAGFATADEADYEDRALNAGAGERKDSLATIDFMHRLDHVVENGEVLFDDGKIRLVRLLSPP
ncbi:MAG TPA: hypothetical protein VK752_00155 [Bryobacteraceae bacterium]|jgi:hypothetical protein|nr:hypothetical protein [Bryobacteraceae bacterium]